jgi:hypothetical protein
MKIDDDLIEKIFEEYFDCSMEQYFEDFEKGFSDELYDLDCKEGLLYRDFRVAIMSSLDDYFNNIFFEKFKQHRQRNVK